MLPDHDRDTTVFWRPELPGRRAFEFAKEVLHSKVEPMPADFQTVDLDIGERRPHVRSAPGAR